MSFSSVTPHEVLMRETDQDVRKKVAYQADGMRHAAEYTTTVTQRTYFVRGPADATLINSHRDIGFAGAVVNNHPWSKSISGADSEIVTEFLINYNADGTAEGKSETTQLDADGWTLSKKFKPEPLPEEYM